MDVPQRLTQMPLLAVDDYLISAPNTEQDGFPSAVATMDGGNPMLLRDISDGPRIPLSSDIDTGRWDLYPLRAPGSCLTSECCTPEVLAQGLCGICVDDSTRYHPTSRQGYREHHRENFPRHTTLPMKINRRTRSCHVGCMLRRSSSQSPCPCD